MKKATLKQGGQIINMISELECSQVQKGLLGSGLLSDLCNAVREGKKIDRNKYREVCGFNILKLSSKPFDPAKFIGKGVSIWKGPSGGKGLYGDKDQDEQSLRLTEVDISKIILETCLKDGESSITGEERLKRLKSTGDICLDARVFRAFWENQDRIPESFKERVNRNIRYIHFDGTILRSSGGNRCSLYLCWHDGQWYWGYFWLDNDWYANGPSALLVA